MEKRCWKWELNPCGGYEVWWNGCNGWWKLQKMARASLGGEAEYPRTKEKGGNFLCSMKL